MNNKEKFYKYLNDINDMSYLISILDWEVKMNVPNDTVSEVNDLIYKYNIKLFKMKTSKKYADMLKFMLNDKSIGDVEMSHLKKLYKDYCNYKDVPLSFYKKYLNLCGKANMSYQKAKEANDINVVLKDLDKMVTETKKLYGYRENVNNIYDEMLSDYEDGYTSKEIDKLFDEVKKVLVPFIKKHKKSITKLNYKFDKYQLERAAILLLETIGFDFNKGDVNLYANAFTGRLGFKDVRITFNDNANPCNYACTVIHEGGHALVESNISEENLKYATTSLRCLTGLHESQSRFFENIIGRNKNFWSNIYNEYKSILKLDLEYDEFIEALNTISPTPIRLDADEVSYCMHIIIRYELERDLFNGKISVYDLKEEWKKKYKEYLGVECADDADNFLQDVHWSQGSFGYFPTYLLGTIYSFMFLEALEKSVGPIDDILSDGNISTIITYLRDNIYKYGGAYSSKKLLKRLGYNDITIKPMIKYFKSKYEN